MSLFPWIKMNVSYGAKKQDISNICLSYEMNNFGYQIKYH